MVMGRNMAVVILDEDGTERAVHRITYGARLRVDDGDKVKRGQRLAEWDPYTRPVLTEIEGAVDFEDLVEGVSVSETARRVDRHHQAAWSSTGAPSPRGADLKPAMVIKDKKGKVGKLRAAARPATCCRSTPSSRSSRAIGEGGRRARAYPDGKRQDARHHRRSAAGGRAVRGASSEGSRHHRRDLRHDAASAATTRTSGASSSSRTTRAASRSSI